MIKKLKKQGGLPAQSGFTILESIIAILILSLSISGAFSAVQQSLSQATIAKDEVRAFYLAQEAVEVIRNLRDNNQLAIINTGTGDWLDGISNNNVIDPCYFGKTCEVDARGPGTPVPIYLFACSGSWGSCDALRQNPTTFLVGYDSSWTVTNFKREVQIESVNANEIAVIVRVSWTKGILNEEFKIKTFLFNWI